MATWIEDIAPDAPARVLARKTLKLRLRHVRQTLRQAARGDGSREDVHRLRVATRRAVAALEAFDDWLPGKRSRRLRKQLHQARRAAGEVRDLDVFEKTVEPCFDEHDCAEPVVAARTEQARENALPRIALVRSKFKRRGFAEQARALLKRVRCRRDGACRPEPTVRDEAVRCLRGPVEEFREAGSADLSDLEHLHQFRIAGKHLRYSLEIFGGAIDAATRDRLLAELVGLQDSLGDINDLWSANARLSEWIEQASTPQDAAQLEQLREKVHERLRQQRLDFLQLYSLEKVEQFLVRLQQALDGGANSPSSAPSSNGQAHSKPSSPTPTQADSDWLPDFTD